MFYICILLNKDISTEITQSSGENGLTDVKILEDLHPEPYLPRHLLTHFVSLKYKMMAKIDKHRKSRAGAGMSLFMVSQFLP